MGKPYTWEEVKRFLEKELMKSEHIMTFGTIGSLNIENDIDLIITRRTSSKTSDFYKELHNLFDSLNIYLKNKHGAKSVCFATMLEEQTLKYLKSYSDKDLGFHLMIYFSYPQMKIDWIGAQNVNLKKLVLEKYSCLKGSPKDLFNKDFQKKKHYDPTYNFLFYADKSNSSYPSELYLQFMNKILDYLSRKSLKIEQIQAKDVNEIRPCFYRLCDEVDKLEGKK